VYAGGSTNVSWVVEDVLGNDEGLWHLQVTRA